MLTPDRKVLSVCHRFLGQASKEAKQAKTQQKSVSSLTTADANPGPGRKHNRKHRCSTPGCGEFQPTFECRRIQSNIQGGLRKHNSGSTVASNHSSQARSVPAFFVVSPRWKLSFESTRYYSIGANIGYTGPRCSRFVPNSRSARRHGDALLKRIQSEVSLSHSVGLFKDPPFQNFTVNNLRVRPKKNRKFRVIMYMSRPKGNGVNDYINVDDFPLAFCRGDDAFRCLTIAGRGALAAKANIQQTFRLVPVRPADWNITGFRCEGEYCFDIALPFFSADHLFTFFASL